MIAKLATVMHVPPSTLLEEDDRTIATLLDILSGKEDDEE